MASLPPITINTEVSSCRGELRERHRHEGKLSGLNLTPMGQKINKITKVNSRVRDTGHHPVLQALRILTNHTSHSPHQKLAIDIGYRICPHKTRDFFLSRDFFSIVVSCKI